MLYRKADFYKTTRFKTAILYSALFLLLEFTSSIIFYFYIKDLLIKDIDNSLTNQSKLIFQLLDEKKITSTEFQPDSIYTPQEEYVINLLHQAVALNPRNTFIQVKYSGDLIFLTDNLRDRYFQFPVNQMTEFYLTTLTDTSISDHEIRAALLNKNNYEIIVAAPTVLLNKTLRHIINYNIYLTPIFFFLAVVGGAIISFKSLARIDSIINKAKEISAHNLEEKIPGEEYVDEYGRLVRTLNDMNLRTKKSVDYMNQFTIAVSHELKTPLTILQGEIDIALKSKKSVEEYVEVLKSNYEETLRLKKIIEQLFLISKLDFLPNELKKQSNNVELILKNIVDTLQGLAFQKNKKIELEIYERKMQILAEENLLKNAIINLIDNAIKYGEKDSVIKITAEKTFADKIKISVNNRGRTIPKELYEKIFERFFRSEGSREREPGGMGLGLTIAKTIVELHGGKIFVESDSEKGTTFNILLDASK